VIAENAHKYSISAMCKVLKIQRSTYYYKEKPAIVDSALENAVIEEFRRSRNNYGTRKLKIVLNRRGFVVSRRKIGKIMKKYLLVSNYTLRQKKRKKFDVNNDEVANVVNREFDERKKYEVVVSDLTYIKIAGKWYYLCVLLDLCGRKILGSAIGSQRNAKLVETAFYSVQTDLRNINLFHTDRGSEFKNHIVEQILTAFGIKRSLSPKGSPIDNAVAEAMYNIIKTEFVFACEYADLAEFKLLWFDYVNWYNHSRIHGSLAYMTPNEWHNFA
jgi:transposase InsO family protein